MCPVVFSLFDEVDKSERVVGARDLPSALGLLGDVASELRVAELAGRPSATRAATVVNSA